MAGTESSSSMMNASSSSGDSPDSPRGNIFRRLISSKRGLSIASVVVAVAVIGAVIFAVTFKREPQPNDTLDQAFPTESQLKYLPDCRDISDYANTAFDFDALNLLADEAAKINENSDAEGYLSSKGITQVPDYSAEYSQKLDDLTNASLLQMVETEHPGFKMDAKQLAAWSSSWQKLVLETCSLTSQVQKNQSTLKRVAASILSAKTFASEQHQAGRAVKDAFPGYPLVVSIGSIYPKVAVWIQRDSPVDQVVALAPGVYSPYNPNIPNLSKYYNSWTTLYGDCGMMRAYFSPMSYSCGPGITAGSEEP